MIKYPAADRNKKSGPVEPAEDWEEIGGNPVCYIDALGLCPTCEATPCVCADRFKLGTEEQHDPNHTDSDQI